MLGTGSVARFAAWFVDGHVPSVADTIWWMISFPCTPVGLVNVRVRVGVSDPI